MLLSVLVPATAQAAAPVTAPASVVPDPADFVQDTVAVSVYVPEGAAEVDHVDLVSVAGPGVPDHATATGVLALTQVVSDRTGFHRWFGRPARTWDADRTLVAWSVAADGTPSSPTTALLPAAEELDPPVAATTTAATGWTFDGIYRRLTVYEKDLSGVLAVYSDVRPGWDNPAPAPFTAGVDERGWPESSRTTYWEFVDPPGDGLLATPGTHATVTLVTTDPTATTYTRRYLNIVVGVPEGADVSVTGPTAPRAGSRPAYTGRVLSNLTVVPSSPLVVQTRTATSAWVTRATVVGDADGYAGWTSPALVEGIAVRMISPSVVPSSSAMLVSVHRRVVTARLSASTAPAGARVALSGIVVGARYGTAVTIWRCAALTGRCSAYAATRALSGGAYRAIVRAPSRGSSVYYRASVAAASAWTPSALSPRVRLRAT